MNKNNICNNNNNNHNNNSLVLFVSNARNKSFSISKPLISALISDNSFFGRRNRPVQPHQVEKSP